MIHQAPALFIPTDMAFIKHGVSKFSLEFFGELDFITLLAMTNMI